MRSILKDFPSSIIGPLGVEARHPDEFILRLLDMAEGMVADAARTNIWKRWNARA